VAPILSGFVLDLAGARHHRFDLGAAAHYRADAVDRDVLDLVAAVADPKLPVDFNRLALRASCRGAAATSSLLVPPPECAVGSAMPPLPAPNSACAPWRGARHASSAQRASTTRIS
jgi:hypothetical protein